MVSNSYLVRNLDTILNLSETLKQYQNRFILELINSSFLIAHDEKHAPVLLIINNMKYALIFTDKEEYEKAFPGEDSALEMEFGSLKNALNGLKLDGAILNVSSQNVYLSRKFINDLNHLPNILFDCSEACTAEEIKSLKDSIDNKNLDEFIKSPRQFHDLITIISSNPLFAAVTSEKDMEILEDGGLIDTIGFSDNYEYYSHDGHVVIFTDEDRLKSIETSKFKYLSLVDFAVIAHHSIRNELKGIAINPNDENYIIPTETLVENWPLINSMCHNERLISAKRYLFIID